MVRGRAEKITDETSSFPRHSPGYCDICQFQSGEPVAGLIQRPCSNGHHSSIRSTLQSLLSGSTFSRRCRGVSYGFSDFPPREKNTSYVQQEHGQEKTLHRAFASQVLPKRKTTSTAREWLIFSSILSSAMHTQSRPMSYGLARPS